MVGALLCVVAAEGPILDLSNSAHQRGASTISLPQPPDDTPIGSAGSSACARQVNRLASRSGWAGSRGMPRFLGCLVPQGRSELWTGTIGARRAWTVSMISV